MRRAVLFFCAGVIACSGGGASGGDAPALDADAGPGAGTPEAGPTDGGAEDAPHDAASAELPACLGESRALVLDRGLPFTEVRVGASPSPYAGELLVDFATTRSAIDLAAFTAPGPPATGCNAALLGQSCTFADLDFFGPWGSVTLVTEDLSGGAGVREAGILGTDFLSVNAFTLDYAHARIFRATPATRCDAASLPAFAPLSTTGFFANDTSSLRPMTDVDSQASGGHVPNVPTVPMRLAGTSAIVQLDTGFLDGLVPHSVNVNVALFDAATAAKPGALVRDASLDAQLSTCAGVAEPVEAYRLAAGASFELVDTSGASARAWPSAVVFVKRTPPAAKSCGGIGTWTAPAAQLGASFFVDAGVWVFDPFASRVFVAR